MKLRAAPSFLRDLVTAFKAKPWPLEKPTVLQFPVNDICNSGCEMCNIWTRKRDTEITPAQLDTVLSDPLFSRIVNVGINGGEPTLRRDLAELVRVACERLPSLRRFSLITNALVPRRVIPSIEALAAVTLQYDKHLDVMLSLDGVGAVHDRVRGRRGNFVAVQQVLEHVRQVRGVNSHQFGFTIVRDNVHSLWATLDFALREQTYIKFRLGVPHRRLYTQGVHEPFALTEEERFHVSVFLQNLLREYETGAQQRETYRSLIGQLAYDAPRAAGCNWQHRGVTLTSRAELAYCAVESRALGDATRTPSSILYFDNAPYMREIIETKCSRCSHDYGGISPGVGFLRQTATEIGLLSRNATSRYRRWTGHAAHASFVLHLRRLEAVPTESAPRRAGRILLCGWYGTETLGDKAILAGCVSALQAIWPTASFGLASLEPFVSRQTVGQLPALAGIEVMSFEDALQRLEEFETVVFAGGPVMGVKAIGENLVLFRRAAARKLRRILLGCGVGPLGRPFYRRYLAELLALAEVRIYRDSESRALAGQLGVDTARDGVAEDPAHLWLATRPAAVEPSNPYDLLLGLRDWPEEQYGTGQASDLALKERFEQALGHGLLELLRVEPSTRLVPVPMSTNAVGGDDRWYYRKLFRQLAVPADRVDWSMLEMELPPEAVFERFQSAGRVLAMRFHSLVFAAAARRPTLALDYTLGRGKVASLARRLKVPVIELGAMSAEQLVSNLGRLANEASRPTPPGNKDLVAALRQALSLVP